MCFQTYLRNNERAQEFEKRKTGVMDVFRVVFLLMYDRVWFQQNLLLLIQDDSLGSLDTVFQRSGLWGCVCLDMSGCWRQHQI